MRPFYESGEDRANEEKICKKLCGIFRCSFIKLKPSLKIDYALLRGKDVVALMEVKKRNYSSQKIEEMGGLMLSADKWKSGSEWSMFYKVPFVLAIEFEDCIMYGVFENKESEPYNLAIMGRSDRNDKADIEPCVTIPLSKLNKRIEIE